MESNFNIEKFVEYLEKYKADLKNLYQWNANIDQLVSLKILPKVNTLNTLCPFEKELQLKKIVGKKLNDYLTEPDLFYKLCMWLIKDWGGIKSANDNVTIKEIKDFLDTHKHGLYISKFDRISSISKVAAFLDPEKYVIYDSRVAYSLNWIILSQNAGKKYFPIPQGRNSKISAFEMNVLIRLKHIDIYNTTDTKKFDNRRFIKKCDEELFVSEAKAYETLTLLVKAISEKLWEKEPEKQQKLYYTEMLLFAIANREVVMDVINHYQKP